MVGMKFIDLFCGVGGFRWALEALGHKCAFSSDIDPHAQETYALNFGEKPFGDITCIDPSDIPGHDVLCGGFPCQPFSTAGLQQGFNDTKDRGKIIFNILDYITKQRPKVFILENVKGFTTLARGKYLNSVLLALNSIGDGAYQVHHKLLNTLEHGVPQNRPKWYCVGLLVC